MNPIIVNSIEKIMPKPSTSTCVIASCDLTNNGSDQINDDLKKIISQNTNVVIACAEINNEKRIICRLYVTVLKNFQYP